MHDGAEPEIDARDPDSQGPRKTLSFALGLGTECDVSISPRSVVVRLLGHPGQSYFASAGPYIVRWLLETLGLRAITGPTVAYVPSRSPYANRATPAQLAWLLPQPDGLEIRFRPLRSSIAPFDPQPIPTSGELALPAPWHEPPVTEPVVLYVEHGRDVACPHCATSASRHRAVRGSGGAVVCASCGRSFVPAVGP